MWQAEKHRIIERYDERIARHGFSIDALASGTEDRRRLRFKVLAEVGIASGDSVLDLGCGLGDLAHHLAASGLDVDYTGYDINPALVAEAARRHPDLRFEVRDVLEEDFPKFDYIVSSSAFNFRMIDDDNYAHAQLILEKCYRQANKGVAVDFLSWYVDFQTAEAFHYEPERIFRLAKRLTKRVALRHDYPLFEFCVYLYPDFSSWSEAR